MIRSPGTSGRLSRAAALTRCFTKPVKPQKIPKIGTVPIFGAVLLLLACAVAAPAGAQQPSSEEVYAAYGRLLGRPEDRAFFGLPGEHNWRAPGRVPITLYADYSGGPAAVLRDAAAVLSRASGIAFDLAAVRPLELLEEGEPFGLRVIIGQRPEMARAAARAKAHSGALGGFEAGHWPFIFHFSRDETLLGLVWIAEDEPPAAVEASLILACVWALGGVTLGEELKGLVDPTAERPALTPLGEAVFALMYRPELAAGLPLFETKTRALRLLGLAQ